MVEALLKIDVNLFNIENYRLLQATSVGMSTGVIMGVLFMESEKKYD